MLPVHRLVGIGVLLFMAACGPALDYSRSATNQPALSVVADSSTTRTSGRTERADNIVWGRVPHCNCMADAATTNVANALAQANLEVKVQALSPNNGWLYFAITYDPTAMSAEQVGTAIEAGGGQVRVGPP